MIKKGFVLWVGGIEYFLESDKKNITDSIALRFFDKVSNCVSPTLTCDEKRKAEICKRIKYQIRSDATVEKKTLSNGTVWYKLKERDALSTLFEGDIIFFN